MEEEKSSCSIPCLLITYTQQPIILVITLICSKSTTLQLVCFLLLQYKVLQLFVCCYCQLKPHLWRWRKNSQISVLIGERLPTWTSSTSFRFILLQVLYTSYYWHVKWIYGVFHLTHLTSQMLLCQFLVCDMQLRLILIQWINLSIGAMMNSLKLRNPKWMEQVFCTLLCHCVVFYI